MEQTYTVTFLKCQSCSGKNHCDQCSGEVSADLLRRPGIAAARLDLREGRLTLSGADEDALLDAMDDCGLFPG